MIIIPENSFPGKKTVAGTVKVLKNTTLHNGRKIQTTQNVLQSFYGKYISTTLKIKEKRLRT
jgi:hypothetical protein